MYIYNMNRNAILNLWRGKNHNFQTNVAVEEVTFYCEWRTLTNPVLQGNSLRCVERYFPFQYILHVWSITMTHVNYPIFCILGMTYIIHKLIYRVALLSILWWST